ncbi:inducible T-cell costimulator [Ascaphus truei]|uniref:inducible T-cell costimulator n=1 Tax=Ascaphus truei TaxID=8439 RepID=UPI003F5A6AC5
MHICFVGVLLFSQLVTAQTSTSHNPNVVVAFRNGQADLPCQHTPSQDSKFNLTLLKGSERHSVCVLYTDGNVIKFHNWEDQVPCNLSESNGIMSFTLSKLDIKHIDNYICHIQIYFPPPYKNSTVNETYVYIHDSELQRCTVMSRLVMWIFIGLAGFLLLCITVTLSLEILRKQTRKCETSTAVEMNNEYNSEYMPMASVAAARRSAR